ARGRPTACRQRLAPDLTGIRLPRSVMGPACRPPGSTTAACGWLLCPGAATSGVAEKRRRRPLPYPAHIGPLDKVEPIAAAHTHQPAAILHSDTGAVFVKGLHAQHRQAHRQQLEAAVNATLVGTAPRLQWQLPDVHTHGTSTAVPATKARYRFSTLCTPASSDTGLAGTFGIDRCDIAERSQAPWPPPYPRWW